MSGHLCPQCLAQCWTQQRPRKDLLSGAEPTWSGQGVRTVADSSELALSVLSEGRWHYRRGGGLDGQNLPGLGLASCLPFILPTPLTSSG